MPDLHENKGVELEKLLKQKVELSDLIGEKSASLYSTLTAGSHPIKVVHLCTHDFGGAGKAAYRVHKGLQSMGMDSTMLVLNKKSCDPSVKVLQAQFSGKRVISSDIPRYESPVWVQHYEKWCQSMAKYPNKQDGIDVFKDATSAIPFDSINEIQEAEIIQLHWIAGMIDWPNVTHTLNKPIVWTLHDMNPFTGGCHYAGNCKKYMKDCGACPQLGSDDENDLSHHIWQQKCNAFRGLNISIVTPSHWLGQCASNSSLFTQFPISVIPYGFPLNIFRPYSKAEIRKDLNIPESTKVILFGADYFCKRKGFKYLLEALNQFGNKHHNEHVLLTFGPLPQDEKITSKLPILNLGPIDDENQLAKAYSAADVFVLPSLEDNLPNTLIEAMACGVPVVGFKVGGIPEIIDHQKTGYLVEPKDIGRLIEGIEWILKSSAQGYNFSKFCREKVLKKYEIERQARTYDRLYNKIYQHHMGKASNTKSAYRTFSDAITVNARDFENSVDAKQIQIEKMNKELVGSGEMDFGQRDFVDSKPNFLNDKISSGLIGSKSFPQTKAVTVATSLAPRDMESQVKAIESWKKLGFNVVSLNCKQEIEMLQQSFPDVQFVQARRNAKGTLGKPYVYFDDFLEFFKDIDSEICGIVNSDIYLVHDEGIISFIRKESKNSMVYGSRVEIESLNDLNGKFYDDGFDFFFFHKSFLSCFPKSETFIGVTWWDFWAPLILALEGVKIKQLVSPFAYHISHPNRWDEKQWVYMGRHISDYLYRQRCKNIANQRPDTPWAIFDAIHSNATHLYFIDRDLDPEEKVKISYQKIERIALSISTFLKKISIPLQFDELPESFNSTVRGRNQNTYDLNKRGEILLKKEDFKGALKCFSQAIERDPNFSKAHTNAGILYWDIGDVKRALQHFKTALKIDPADRIATLYWAKFLINNNNNKIARMHLSSYLLYNPGDLEIGKILDRFEKGDDISKQINLELDFSRKAKAAKISNINHQNHTFNINSDPQNLDILQNCGQGDAIQSPSRLNADNPISRTDCASIKKASLSSNCLQTAKSPTNLDIELIRKKFPIRYIPNNKEGLIEVKRIQGFLSEDDIIQLYLKACGLPRNGIIIEIGSYLGLSSCVMAQALIDSQNHGARFYCIDDWMDADAYFKQTGGKGNAFDAFRSNLQRVGVDKLIHIKKMKSLDAAADFLDETADLIFLDGDHSFDGCYTDLNAWYSKLKPNGILIGHDYANCFEGIPRAVQKFVKENQLDSSFRAPPNGSSIFEIRMPQTTDGITGVRVASCSNPLISVITPSYNQSKFIEQTIQSVLNQDYSNFEHIVMDGGSTDGTIEILKKYPHLKWVSEKDSGQAEALNKGLKLAQGDIIAWINSDDWYEPDIFKTVATFFINNPAKKIVMSNCNLVNENGIIFDRVINTERSFNELKNYWVGRSIPTQPAVFFKRELLDEFGYTDNSLYYTMDYDLWMRFAQKYKFHHLNVTGANYRFHNAAKIGDQNWSKIYPECQIVRRRYVK
jgi:glycosyltransferase involved in cell wall biosynthesis/tetratricopeptide (TPR) repeat protein/GT2 family glycosyltransferase